MESINYAVLDAALAWVRRTWPEAKPVLGCVLGSGWGSVVESVETIASVPYAELPGMGGTTVAGHRGRLVRARIDGAELLVFEGRRHYFEGAGWTPVALPIYLLKNLGAGAVILTNAAGSLSPALSPGDLMLITDHLNLMGVSPLCGEHNRTWGERFPDLSDAYDQALRDLMMRAAAQTNEPLKFGVYCAALGPAYETPAEVRMLRVLGADAVGMSTVPCAILARAAGLKVIGLSCISNQAAGLSAAPVSHSSVIETMHGAMPRMQRLLGAFFRLYAAQSTAVECGGAARLSPMKARRWQNPYIELARSNPAHLIHAEDGHLTEPQRAVIFGRIRPFSRRYCEIGSGSGGHLIEQAGRDSSAFFLGFELRYKRAFNSGGKAARGGLQNILFVRGQASEMFSLFEADSLDGIFINFPDPWSKRRWQKHRMLNAEFLRSAHALLKPEGFIRYKTDHAEYFDSVLGLLDQLGIFRIHRLSRDLHRSEYLDENVASEFEKLFRSKGLPVFFVEARKIASAARSLSSHSAAAAINRS